ncbi:uncharacterized protein LOC105694591 [Orussus abietinus]|uniref:uncharacterized protein LOC105694591 n=1 Tax=Orussus abietinus TaxID=222816 RepID=UPI00062590A5|nr:uncharacterized protein LOC105694591 [Orussus abietinus]
MRDVKGNMKAAIDPWGYSNCPSGDSNVCNSFEDCFVENITLTDQLRLSDSEQYLERLYSRLKAIKGGTTKKDLVTSLSNVKEDYIARFITAGQSLESVEEDQLTSNPLLRHIVPHLQALTVCELVHLLKADILEIVTNEQKEELAASEDKESEVKQLEKTES